MPVARQIPPFPLLQNLPGAYQPNLGRAGAPAFPNRPNLPIVEPATLPVLSKEKIRQLVTQIDPYERLENDVEEMMMEIADDFITKIAEKSCKLAKHRGSESVAVKDARIPHVEIDWGIRVPGFGGERDDKDDSGDKGQLTDVEKVRLHMTRTNKIREAVRESSRVARGLPGSHTKKGTNARAKRRGVSAGRVNI
ncbi:transcription initiation factor TFIID subunit A-domain-containing protein [Phlyctochytrium arcticum]|nr:transcription initiation factor TFIID subunit A-domain-containing protein [Phlyctochytrium arcticum]